MLYHFHSYHRDKANRRLEIFGLNMLEVEEQNAFLQVCHTPSSPCPFPHFPLVPQFHVESLVMGHGSCSFSSYRSFERSAQASGLARFRRYHPTSLYQFLNRFLRGA